MLMSCGRDVSTCNNYSFAHHFEPVIDSILAWFKLEFPTKVHLRSLATEAVVVRVVVKSMLKPCIVVKWRALYFGMGPIAISELVRCSTF